MGRGSSVKCSRCEKCWIIRAKALAPREVCKQSVSSVCIICLSVCVCLYVFFPHTWKTSTPTKIYFHSVLFYPYLPHLKKLSPTEKFISEESWCFSLKWSQVITLNVREIVLLLKAPWGLTKCQEADKEAVIEVAELTQTQTRCDRKVLCQNCSFVSGCIKVVLEARLESFEC